MFKRRKTWRTLLAAALGLVLGWTAAGYVQPGSPGAVASPSAASTTTRQQTTSAPDHPSKPDSGQSSNKRPDATARDLTP